MSENTLKQKLGFLNFFFITRFGLIGHSLGGGLVLTYAATFPESVSHLVMLDITFVPIRFIQGVPINMGIRRIRYRLFK